MPKKKKSKSNYSNYLNSKTKKVAGGFPKGANDLAWVSNYPELLKGLLGPNFFRKKGLTESPINNTTAGAGTIGSVASIELILSNGATYGKGYDMAIDKLYTSLRSANTGSVAYNKIDLQRYMWNARMLLALTRYARRAYGVARKYSLTDKSMPISIFKAMGLDYDSWTSELSNLRQRLNLISTRLHTVLPYKDDTMERTCWLFDHIFTDGKSDKAQLYLFSLNSRLVHYDYNNSTWDATTGITNYANNATTTGTTYSVFMAALESILDDTVNNNINSIIAADILKCYGIETTKYYSVIDENYTVEPVYNEEVLTEIQNADLIGEVTASNTAVQDGKLTVTEVGSYLQSQLYNPHPNANSLQLRVGYMNTYKPNLNNAEVVTFTNFKTAGIISTAVTGRVIWDIRGTETATVIRYVKATIASGTYAHDVYALAASKYMNVALSSAIAAEDALFTFAAWSQFDWSPMIGYATMTVGDPLSPVSVLGGLFPLWDFESYALVDHVQLESYRDIQIMSQYNAASYIRDIKLTEVK